MAWCKEWSVVLRRLLKSMRKRLGYAWKKMEELDDTPLYKAKIQNERMGHHFFVYTILTGVAARMPRHSYIFTVNLEKCKIVQEV